MLLTDRTRGKFNPVNLSNLAVWYDPSDATTVTLNSGNVSSLADKSGNGITASQATALRQIPYSIAGKNGLNVLAPTGTQYLAATLSSTPAAMTVVVAGVATNGGPTGVGRIWAIVGSNAGITSESGNFKYFSPLINSNVAHTVPSVLTVRFTSLTVADLFVGATAVNSPFDPDNSYSGATALQIANDFGIDFWNGQIFEFLIYYRALTQAEITLLNTYLTTKWAL